MIKIENVEVHGFEPAIRGMRNPKNSWDRSDSKFGCGDIRCSECVFWGGDCEGDNGGFSIGSNDAELMLKLANGGPVHAKYRRMITVYMDITAPLYWWKEFDTYKVGTVANSCSTMHKIADKEFTLHDFSCEHLTSNGVIDEPRSANNWDAAGAMLHTIDVLNYFRDCFVAHPENKTYWWQMIQLLPSSYNQKRTIMLNYEVLTGIYKHRKDHKLDEWREFCRWINTLPMSEIITGYYVTKLSALSDNSKDIVLSDGSVSIEEAAYECKDDPIVKAVTDEANMSKSKPKIITEMTVAELFEDFENQRHVATLEDYLYMKIEEAANAKKEEKAND